MLTDEIETRERVIQKNALCATTTKLPRISWCTILDIVADSDKQEDEDHNAQFSLEVATEVDSYANSRGKEKQKRRGFPYVRSF